MSAGDILERSKMYQSGDIVVRILPPYEGSMGASVYKGVVESVNDDVVTCRVQVDLWRTMRFFKTTGINVNGLDYGFIVPGKDVSWIFEE